MFFKKLRIKVESKRNSNSLFWKFLVKIKDYSWYLFYYFPIVNGYYVYFFKYTINPFHREKSFDKFFDNYDCKIKTYCINLNKRKDKREFMKKQFEKVDLKYSFFNAIDGNRINVNDLIKKGTYKGSLLKSEIGCYLSHLTIWEEIVSKKQEITLILEDDSEFNFNKKILNEFLGNIPVDFDIIYLNLRDNKRKVISKYLSVFKEGAYGTTAYILSLKGAKKLLNFCVPIETQIDQKLFQLTKNKKIIVYGSSKELVSELSNSHIPGLNYFKSDIKEY